MQIMLNPDAPTDPDYTRDVASAVSEGVRVLNHHTQKPGSLRAPSHVYDVVARLAAAAGGMPQLLGQLAQWLIDQDAAGHVTEVPGGPHGGDTTAAVNTTAAHLHNAMRAATQLASHLQQAQNAASGLAYRAPKGREQ